MFFFSSAIFLEGSKVASASHKRWRGSTKDSHKHQPTASSSHTVDHTVGCESCTCSRTMVHPAQGRSPEAYASPPSPPPLKEPAKGLPRVLSSSSSLLSCSPLYSSHPRRCPTAHPCAETGGDTVASDLHLSKMMQIATSGSPANATGSCTHQVGSHCGMYVTRFSPPVSRAPSSSPLFDSSSSQDSQTPRLRSPPFGHHWRLLLLTLLLLAMIGYDFCSWASRRSKATRALDEAFEGTFRSPLAEGNAGRATTLRFQDTYWRPSGGSPSVWMGLSAFLPIPLPAEAISVHYHGTVYRGLEDTQIRDGGATFSVSVAVPAFPMDEESVRYILAGILCDHVQLIDEDGFPILEDTHIRDDALRMDGGLFAEKYTPEVIQVLREWRAAVHTMLGNSEIVISPNRQTVSTVFAPVDWRLNVDLDVSLLVIPCLPFGLFQQLEAVGIPDLPHNCLAGDPFVIRRVPFPKVIDPDDLGFLVTGKRIVVPIWTDPHESLDRFSMERSLRVVEGTTCLHTRNAPVRGSQWDTQLSEFRFTPYRGGVNSLCFAPFPDTVPLLQLKLMHSFEVAGPEGVSTDPPQVRAEVEFTGTIFGTNFSELDTAVMTEDLCSDFSSQNVFFVELMYISSSRMSFVGTFHKRGIYHVCYHRYGSTSYVRVSTLLVEKGSEVVVDSETANVLIDQDVKLLTSATVKKLKVQNKGNLVLKQRSLNVQAYFIWSGGTITGHGLINTTGYGRITTEGYETRQLQVPLYNYGELTIDVQRLTIDKDGCIHNYGNLTLTVSSMGSEDISSITSATERNAIFNYEGAILRIIALQDHSFSLLTNYFILEAGGIVMISGRITMTNLVNGVNSLVVVKQNSALTLFHASLAGNLHVEAGASVIAMDKTIFSSTVITGGGKFFVRGEGIVLESTHFAGSLVVIMGTPPELADRSIISVTLINKNVFGPDTFVLLDSINLGTGGSRSTVKMNGAAVVLLDGVFFAGMADVEVASRGLMYTARVAHQQLQSTRADKHLRELVVHPSATCFLIDLMADDPGEAFTPGTPLCNEFVGVMSHLWLHGTMYLRGCVHTTVTAEINGTLKSMRSQEEWNEVLVEYCGADHPAAEHMYGMCLQLRSKMRHTPGYGGFLSRGETFIRAPGVINVDEFLTMRGHVIVLDTLTVLATKHMVVSGARFALEAGGTVRTPLLAVKGLLELYDPMSSEVDGNVTVARDCFVRLRGVPSPCEPFFKVTGGIVAEATGHQIFHCVDQKATETNYTRYMFGNLPADISCPNDLLEYMRERWMFLAPHMKSWPSLNQAVGLTYSNMAYSILASVTLAFVVLKVLLRLFGLRFNEWLSDLRKPSPLNLTVTWNEFKSNPHNYLALAFYVMSTLHGVCVPFHPFLAVPFPKVTIFSIRNSQLLLPFFTSHPSTPFRLSLVVMLWCLLVALSKLFFAISKKKYTKLLPISSFFVNAGWTISMVVSFAAPHVVSTIGDGISCTTVLKHEPACAGIVQYHDTVFHTITTLCAYLLVFIVIPWSAAGHRDGMGENELRAKASLMVVTYFIVCVQVSLWKIFAFYPRVHVVLSFIITCFQFLLVTFFKPTPFQNLNKIIMLGIGIRFPVFAVIFFYQFRLHMGWISRCDECSYFFYGSFALAALGVIFFFLVRVVYVTLPDGSVGDPSIDALRRSIAQIRARIEEIKKSIPYLNNAWESENAQNAVSRLRVELLEKQDRYKLEVQRLLYPFYFVHPYPETQPVKPKPLISTDLLDLNPSPTTSSVSANWLSEEEMESFSCGPPLGKGSYGTVYLGILTTGKLVAVKYINVATASKDVLQNVKSEVEMLMDLNHPNVIRYYGAHSMDNTMMIFMEFAVGGSLASIVRKFAVLTEPVMQLYTYQILSGLLYLHHKGVVHRDIKGENILIDGDGVSKLADFGCSKALANLANASQAGCGTLVGSPFWMAPEVIRSEAYGTKADIWSVGCTVVEMLNGGEPPWKSAFENAYSAMFYVGSTTDIPAIPDETSEACRDFLHRCFERDVAKRASAEELLQHEWLSQVPSRTIGGTPLRTDSQLGLSGMGEDSTARAESFFSPYHITRHTAGSTTSPSFVDGGRGRSFPGSHVYQRSRTEDLPFIRTPVEKSSFPTHLTMSSRGGASSTSQEGNSGSHTPHHQHNSDSSLRQGNPHHHSSTGGGIDSDRKKTD